MYFEITFHKENFAKTREFIQLWSQSNPISDLQLLRDDLVCVAFWECENVCVCVCDLTERIETIESIEERK